MSGGDAGDGAVAAVAAAPVPANMFADLPPEAATGSEPTPPARNSGQEQLAQRLLPEVNKCKAVLENKDAAVVEQIAALRTLGEMGSLPTKVLSDTLIGKTVNSVAKAATDEGVRAKAKDLVEQWRQAHRKRKSSDNLGGSQPQPPTAKRGRSDTGLSSRQASFDSEAAGLAPTLSQLSQDSASQQASLPRQDSLLSLGEESLDLSSQRSGNGNGGGNGGPIPPHREKVREKLVEVFGQVEEIEAKGGNQQAEERTRDPVMLASEIDQALNAVFPKKEEYMVQARSILYNLKDKKNPTFRFKVLVGFYKPADIPKLTAEDMASDEKNEERKKQRKYAMEEIQTDWALKNGQQRITGMFTCGKCKGMKTTYFQMQTRSSDEPMTTFVTCLTCNNRWKFC